MKKIFLNAFILFAVALVFAGCTSKLFPKSSIKNQEVPAVVVDPPQEATVPVQPKDEINEISYTFIAENDGQNVMDLLGKNAEVITETSDLGEMIKGINGIMSTNDQYWSFYINGKMAMQSASKTILKKGDIVEWRFEKI